MPLWRLKGVGLHRAKRGVAKRPQPTSGQLGGWEHSSELSQVEAKWPDVWAPAPTSPGCWLPVQRRQACPTPGWVEGSSLEGFGVVPAAQSECFNATGGRGRGGHPPHLPLSSSAPQLHSSGRCVFAKTGKNTTHCIDSLGLRLRGDREGLPQRAHIF